MAGAEVGADVVAVQQGQPVDEGAEREALGGDQPAGGDLAQAAEGGIAAPWLPAGDSCVDRRGIRLARVRAAKAAHAGR